MGATGTNRFFFFFFFFLPGGPRFVFWCGPGGEAIRNGWGCLSYLFGVIISDLVYLTVSQTLADYWRLSWYVLGCFSLKYLK